MSSLTRPRGPLPRRVYWVRRLMVLGIATLLVVGLGRILTAGSDAAGGPDQARQAGAAASTSTVGATSNAGAGGEAKQKQDKNNNKKNKKKRKRGKNKPQDPTQDSTQAPTQGPTVPAAPPLAQPTGPCADSDVVVTPLVSQVVGGAAVPIVLSLTTREAAACTWTASPDTLTVKITSGEDDIWSSRHCPAAIPAQDLVVRQAQATPITVMWSGRRSDETCSALTAWALPGYYHVAAAALAGEPADVQFELVAPAPPTVTTTITPSPDPSDKKKNKKKKRP